MKVTTEMLRLRTALPQLVLVATLTACPEGSKEDPREEQEVAQVNVGPRHTRVAVERRDARDLVGRAHMAAIADFSGNGEPQIALADESRLRIVTLYGEELATREVRGDVQVLRAVRLDADGGAAIIAGFGRTRHRRDGRAYAAVYRLREGKLEEEPLVSPETERAEIVALLPWPRQGRTDLFVAYFDSRYFVACFVARRLDGRWSLEPLGRIRMATSFALGDVRGDGSLSLIVGRVYGDSTEEDGEAFMLEPSGARIPVPTTRGVRGLAVADIDGDGRAEVFLGDGWHRDYGKIARGQLTVAAFREGGFASEPALELPGQYTLWQLEPAALRDEVVLIARGSAGVFILRREGESWTHTAIAGEAQHVAVGDLDGEPGDEVLVLSDRPEIIGFR